MITFFNTILYRSLDQFLITVSFPVVPLLDMRYSICCILFGILDSSVVQDPLMDEFVDMWLNQDDENTSKQSNQRESVATNRVTEISFKNWWFPHRPRVYKILANDNIRTVLEGLVTILKEIYGNELTPKNALKCVNDCLRSHGKPTVLYKTIYDISRRLFVHARRLDPASVVILETFLDSYPEESSERAYNHLIEQNPTTPLSRRQVISWWSYHSSKLKKRH